MTKVKLFSRPRILILVDTLLLILFKKRCSQRQYVITVQEGSVWSLLEVFFEVSFGGLSKEETSDIFKYHRRLLPKDRHPMTVPETAL